MFPQYRLGASEVPLRNSGQVFANCTDCAESGNILLKVATALTNACGMALAILVFQELSSSTDWRFDVVRKSACIINWYRSKQARFGSLRRGSYFKAKISKRKICICV
jgi:hypothetical protein